MERIVKPSGTIAVWVHGNGFVMSKDGSQPISLRPIMEYGFHLPEIERYSSPGNYLALTEYEDFPLPDDVGSKDSKWKEVVRKRLADNIPEEEWEIRSAKDFVRGFSDLSV
jgi:hypothetical protein